MNFIKRLQRPTSLAAAALLLVAAAAPLFVPNQAFAYGLPTERQVKISSSTAGATGVSYEVSFKAATTSVLQGLVIEICDNSPIIGDTCTTPAGFSWGAASNPQPSFNGTAQTGWTGAVSAGKFTLTNAAGATSVAAGQLVSFTITTATNPSTSNTTFYGRMLSFATSAAATGYTATTPGSSIDAGGTALSTADQITIQAKVQERLTFCIYTSAASASCTGNTTTNPVVLGDANGVLSSTSPSISKTAKYNITTNASLGATIRAKGSTLTSGSFTIDPAGAGSATGAQYAAGSEQFGLCTYRETGAGAGTSTGLAPTTQYDGENGGTSTATSCSGSTAGQGAGFSNNGFYAFDTTTANSNFTSTYGVPIATKTAGDFSTGILTFLGGVSNTTEPGIYTSTLTFIATGVY